jgi:hypothetical protein
MITIEINEEVKETYRKSHPMYEAGRDLEFKINTERRRFRQERFVEIFDIKEVEICK